MSKSTVTIKYDPSLINKDLMRKGANICNTFEPGGSYVDSEALEGSKLDSNHYGMDSSVPQADIYARTKIPSGGYPSPYFDLAVQAANTSTTDSNKGVSFEVDNYKEAMHFRQLAEDMKDQGFDITVEDADSESTDSSVSNS